MRWRKRRRKPTPGPTSGLPASIIRRRSSAARSAGRSCSTTPLAPDVEDGNLLVGLSAPITPRGGRGGARRSIGSSTPSTTSSGFAATRRAVHDPNVRPGHVHAARHRRRRAGRVHARRNRLWRPGKTHRPRATGVDAGAVRQAALGDRRPQPHRRGVPPRRPILAVGPVQRVPEGVSQRRELRHRQERLRARTGTTPSAAADGQRHDLVDHVRPAASAAGQGDAAHWPSPATACVQHRRGGQRQTGRRHRAAVGHRRDPPRRHPRLLVRRRMCRSTPG